MQDGIVWGDEDVHQEEQMSIRWYLECLKADGRGQAPFYEEKKSAFVMGSLFA